MRHILDKKNEVSETVLKIVTENNKIIMIKVLLTSQ